MRPHAGLIAFSPLCKAIGIRAETPWRVSAARISVGPEARRVANGLAGAIGYRHSRTPPPALPDDRRGVVSF